MHLPQSRAARCFQTAFDSDVVESAIPSSSYDLTVFDLNLFYSFLEGCPDGIRPDGHLDPCIPRT